MYSRTTMIAPECMLYTQAIFYIVRYNICIVKHNSFLFKLDWPVSKVLKVIFVSVSPCFTLYFSHIIWIYIYFIKYKKRFFVIMMRDLYKFYNCIKKTFHFYFFAHIENMEFVFLSTFMGSVHVLGLNIHISNAIYLVLFVKQVFNSQLIFCYNFFLLLILDSLSWQSTLLRNASKSWINPKRGYISFACKQLSKVET